MRRVFQCLGLIGLLLSSSLAVGQESPSLDAIRTRIRLSHGDMWDMSVQDFKEYFLEPLKAEGIVDSDFNANLFDDVLNIISKDPSLRLTEENYVAATRRQLIKKSKFFNVYPSQIETFIKGAVELIQADETYAAREWLEEQRQKHIQKFKDATDPITEEALKNLAEDDRRLSANLIRKNHFYTLKVLGQILGENLLRLLQDPVTVNWLQTPIAEREGIDTINVLSHFDGASREIRESLFDLDHDESDLGNAENYRRFAATELGTYLRFLLGDLEDEFFRARQALENLFGVLESTRSGPTSLDILNLIPYLNTDGKLKTASELKTYLEKAAAQVQNKTRYNQMIRTEIPKFYDIVINPRHSEVLSEAETNEIFELVEALRSVSKDITPTKFARTRVMADLPKETLGRKIYDRFLDPNRCQKSFDK
jgi:hypothetical protein